MKAYIPRVLLAIRWSLIISLAAIFIYKYFQDELCWSDIVSFILAACLLAGPIDFFRKNKKKEDKI